MDAILGYTYYIHSALRKLPNYKGVVYRGNRTVGIVKKEYYAGCIIFWSGFTSTTVDINVAQTFAGQDGVVFRINVSNGKVIAALSVLGGEKEVLLLPNAGLVVSKEMHTELADGKQYLDLVEVSGHFRW
jgi:hypothetical protein